MTLRIKQQEREKYSFYDGEIELEYDPIDHVYLLDNTPIPSVTQIVKVIDKSAVLINWAVKLTVDKILASVQFPISEEGFKAIVLEAKSAHRVRLEDASNVGKQAHSMIEERIKHDLFGGILLAVGHPRDERVWNCYLAALDWMKRHNVRWICTERKIYSKTYKYAGTLDGIAIVDSCTDPRCCPNEFKDRYSLIDWKSSNQLYNEYLFQTAAYQYAIEEELGQEIIDRWVIRLGKDDGEFEAWHIEKGHEEDFTAFLSCLSLTRAIDSVKIRMKERKRRVKMYKKEKEEKNVKEAVIHSAEADRKGNEGTY
jgi:hypothetical protein